MIYCVTYRIHVGSHDYSSLYEAIKSVGKSCIHPMENAWFVSVDETVGPGDIYQALQPHFHKEDSFFIVSILPQNQIEGVAGKCLWEWLRENGHP